MRLDGIPYTMASAAGIGHAHFCRGALQMAGAAGLALAGARILRPAAAWAASAANGADPRPIPGGVLVVDGRRYHVYPPGPSNPLDPSSVLNEPSSITDFDGVVAVTQVQGTGMEQGDGPPAHLAFDADMRIMAGRYVGIDGEILEATFGTDRSRYDSDPAATSKTVFAAIGRERNGVFLR